jgi:hypothetical protein
MDSPPFDFLNFKPSTDDSAFQLSRNFFPCREMFLGHRKVGQVLLDRLSQVSFPARNKFARQRNGGGAQPNLAMQQGPREGNVLDLNQRIEAMHKRDVAVAWAFVIGMWFSVIFVAFTTWGLAPSGTARVALLFAGAMILLFNTAAILAMLRHYREDRDFIYGLDIKFLDEARGR